MKHSILLRKEVEGTVEKWVEQLTKALAAEGFGILTRIDFHTKLKEKLGKDIPPTVILGACNPQLAFEAYSRNAEITGLVPCNAVVREISNTKVALELTKPSALMQVLGNRDLETLAEQADARLAKVLSAI